MFGQHVRLQLFLTMLRLCAAFLPHAAFEEEALRTAAADYVLMACGCSLPAIAQAARPLLPLLPQLCDSARLAFFDVASREELVGKVAQEVRAARDVSLFELYQLERLLPVFPKAAQLAPALLHALSEIAKFLSTQRPIRVRREEAERCRSRRSRSSWSCCGSCRVCR